MAPLNPFSYIRSISIYLVFNVLSAILPLITLPIFTKYMMPSDYGIFAVFSIMCMFSGNIFRMELNAALKRVYAEDADKFPLFLNSALYFSNGLLLLFAALLLAALPWLSDYQGVATPWYFVILLLAYLRFHSVTLHHLLQLTNRPLLYGVWGLIVNLLTFGVAFIILYWKDLGWQARAWSELLVAVMAFPVTLFFFRKDFGLRLQFDWHALKTMLRFSLPLLLTSMIGYCLLVMDRLFIAELVDSEQLGLYTVAVQLSAVVGLFFGAILPVWESWIYRRTATLCKQDFYRIIRRLGAMVAIAFLFYIFVPPLLIWSLPYLLDRSFVGTDVLLKPVIMAALAAALFGLTGPVLTFMRKVAFITKLNIAMLLLGIPIMYFFVQRWGTVGAAYGLTTLYGAGLICMLLYIYQCANSPPSSLQDTVPV